MFSTLLQISFGSILTPVGLGMLVYGFGGFFNLLPGGDISSLLLIYGFVISLLGFALSYAQLKPVPCKTTAEAFALRDSQCTDIQKQVHGTGKHPSNTPMRSARRPWRDACDTLTLSLSRSLCCSVFGLDAH